MLTPQEISEKEFVKAVFGGYDMSAVDDFLESLTADYSLLYKENAILKSKIKVLVEKVEEYRSTEDAMRMALLTAQKMGDEMMTDAQKKSEAMVQDAENAVAAKLAESEKLIKDKEYRLAAAKEATENYIAKSRELMQQQADFLSALDEISRPAEEPAVDSDREAEIIDAAREIDSAVAKLVEEETEAVDEDIISGPSPEEVAEALKRAMSGTDLSFNDITGSYDDEPTRIFTVIPEEETAANTPEFNYDDLKIDG